MLYDCSLSHLQLTLGRSHVSRLSFYSNNLQAVSFVFALKVKRFCVRFLKSTRWSLLQFFQSEWYNFKLLNYFDSETFFVTRELLTPHHIVDKSYDQKIENLEYRQDGNAKKESKKSANVWQKADEAKARVSFQRNKFVVAEVDWKRRSSGVYFVAAVGDVVEVNIKIVIDKRARG